MFDKKKEDSEGDVMVKEPSNNEEYSESSSDTSSLESQIGIGALIDKRAKLEESIEKKFYKEIPITMTIAGVYYRTAGFFDTLQGLLRMVNISKLIMERKTVQVPEVGEYCEIKRKGQKMVVTEIKAKTFAFIEGSEIQE